MNKEKDDAIITIAFKPHEQRELVNRIRNAVRTHGRAGSMRDVLSRIVNDFIKTHKEETK